MEKRSKTPLDFEKDREKCVLVVGAGSRTFLGMTDEYNNADAECGNGPSVPLALREVYEIVTLRGIGGTGSIEQTYITAPLGGLVGKKALFELLVNDISFFYVPTVDEIQYLRKKILEAGL